MTPPRSGTVGNVTIQLERYATVIVDTGRTFEYRHDPWLLDIQPRNHLTVWVSLLLHVLFISTVSRFSNRVPSVATTGIASRGKKKQNDQKRRSSDRKRWMVISRSYNAEQKIRCISAFGQCLYVQPARQFLQGIVHYESFWLGPITENEQSTHYDGVSVAVYPRRQQTHHFEVIIHFWGRGLVPFPDPPLPRGIATAP